MLVYMISVWSLHVLPVLAWVSFGTLATGLGCPLTLRDRLVSLCCAKCECDKDSFECWTGSWQWMEEGCFLKVQGRGFSTEQLSGGVTEHLLDMLMYVKSLFAKGNFVFLWTDIFIEMEIPLCWSGSTKERNEQKKGGKCFCFKVSTY